MLINEAFAAPTLRTPSAIKKRGSTVENTTNAISVHSRPSAAKNGREIAGMGSEEVAERAILAPWHGARTIR